MSPEARTPSFDEWHEALAQRDRAAHAAEDEWMRRAAVVVLEGRVARMNAEITALREAIAFREHLLTEQNLALAERDQHLADRSLALAERDRHLAELERQRAAAPPPASIPRESLALLLRIGRAVLRRVRP